MVCSRSSQEYINLSDVRVFLAALQAASSTTSYPGRCPGLLQFKPFGLRQYCCAQTEGLKVQQPRATPWV